MMLRRKLHGVGKAINYPRWLAGFQPSTLCSQYLSIQRVFGPHTLRHTLFFVNESKIRSEGPRKEPSLQGTSRSCTHLEELVNVYEALESGQSL